jgi:ABC-type multidrug transport system fused ATPase/permease subunit
MSDTPLGGASPEFRKHKESPFVGVLKRLRKNRAAMLGLYIFVFEVAVAILSRWIIPYGYEAMDLKNMLAGPSLKHFFGTDELGRDVFSRIVYGMQYSLSIGIFAVVVAAALGIAIGSIAGYFGGWVDNIIMRVLDIIQAVPGLLLTIALSAVLGSGFDKAILALGIGNVPGYARLLRASILNIRRMELPGSGGGDQLRKAAPHREAPAAEQHLPDDSARHHGRGRCHPGGGVPELHRPGSAAPDSGMGSDARGGTELHPGLPPPGHLPRGEHHDHGSGPEHPGGRPAGRPRPQTQELTGKRQTLMETERNNEAAPYLSVRNLVVEYTSGDEVIHAVNGVSFDLSKGRTLGLVGETGAGKTSIAKAIMRILPNRPPGSGTATSSWKAQTCWR